MEHGHSHHHHSHDHGGSTKALWWGFGLNLAFTLIEIVGGLYTGSVAILADAVHDLGDSASLALALYFERYSQKRPDAEYSFGYRRFSLLSALISGVVILSGSVVILFEAISRFQNPREPLGMGMIGLSVLGLLVNGAAALKMKMGRSQNERMLSWHFVEDALGWLATLIAAVFITWKHWTWVDPALAILLAVWVSRNVWRELRTTLRFFLQAAPADFNVENFSTRVTQLPGVLSLHDLHVWSLDGARHVLSLHVVLEMSLAQDSNRLHAIKQDIKKLAGESHALHVTIETEHGEDDCLGRCDEDKRPDSR